MVLNWTCGTCGYTIRSPHNQVGRVCREPGDSDGRCGGEFSFTVDLAPRTINGRRLRNALKDPKFKTEIRQKAKARQTLDRFIDWDKDPLGLGLLEQLRKDLGRG